MFGTIVDSDEVRKTHDVMVLPLGRRIGSGEVFQSRHDIAATRDWMGGAHPAFVDDEEIGRGGNSQYLGIDVFDGPGGEEIWSRKVFDGPSKFVISSVFRANNEKDAGVDFARKCASGVSRPKSPLELFPAQPA